MEDGGEKTEGHSEEKENRGMERKGEGKLKGHGNRN